MTATLTSLVGVFFLSGKFSLHFSCPMLSLPGHLKNLKNGNKGMRCYQIVRIGWLVFG
jgi:hypothetical protein